MEKYCNFTYILSIIFAFCVTIYLVLSPVGLDSELCTCSKMSRRSEEVDIQWRVVNGTKVSKSFTGLNWIGSIFIKYDTLTLQNGLLKLKTYYLHWCTANAINQKWFLSSRQCFVNLNQRLKKNKNISDFDLYVAAGLNHYLPAIFENKNNNRIVHKYYIKNEPPEISRYENHISLIELVEPFDLGAESGISPCCFLTGKYDRFEGKLMFAGYGLTYPLKFNLTYPLSMSNLDKEELKAQYQVNNNLWLIDDLEQVRPSVCCEELICARSNKSSTCLYDFGGGLIYTHSNQLFVVGILIESESAKSNFCTANSTSFYAPIYSNLDFIDDLTAGQRCFQHKFLDDNSDLILCLLLLAIISFATSFLLSFSARCFNLDDRASPEESLNGGSKNETTGESSKDKSEEKSGDSSESTEDSEEDENELNKK